MVRSFSSPVLLVLLLVSVCLKVVASPISSLPAAVDLDRGWLLQDSVKVPAQGSAVSMPEFKPQSWYGATVPGTVLTTLVNNGVYPEPLYGENNRPDKIPDSLCRTSYWYRTKFTVPTSYAGRMVQLNFEGINYFAEVWLNGHDLGAIKGAFARGTFDITSAVRRNSENILAVEIAPPPHPGVPREHTQANGLYCGGVLAEDGPTFLCTVSWDWIPGIRDRDMGIWQKVFLSAHGPVSVHDTYVTSDLPLPRLDSADLTVRTTVRNESTVPQSGILTGSYGDTTFRYPVSLAPNESRDLALTPSDVPQLHLNNPKLWWPNGYGPQNLYTMKLRFVENGDVSDSLGTSFGVRKITYQVPGSDNLTVSVNGVPVLCKGGDWGMDEALKREPYKRLEAQIRLHRDANYTMIRNWVGQSTSEDFYDLCDKYGIMLWDEFFQPNPHDGPNPLDNDLYLANVREKILRYRSHPSIAVWCGRNEGPPPQDINDGIQKLMDKLDTDRLYQPSSTDGRGVNSGGPYYWRVPRDYYSYGEAFKTEIGSVSIPTLESVEAMMPKKDWNTINDDWAEHDLAGGGSGGDWYPRVIASRYGSYNNLPDFVRKGSMATYEAFRAMYEGRNAKLFNPVTGVLTWMSNPAQPSFVWQIYAWDLEPNAAFFAVRKACEPVHIQLNQDNWHLMVINNTAKNLANLSAKVSVYNMDGTLKYTHTDLVDASPSLATDDGAVSFPDGLSPVHFVEVELRNSQNHLLSDNFYWRETSSNDFTALSTMPRVALTGSVKSAETKGNTTVAITLANTTQTPALMTHVQLRNSRTNLRVLPVYYSDNYVSLLPGESKTITAEVSDSDLGAASPIVLVDGWNVSVKPAKGIAPNVDAIKVDPAPGTAPPVASADGSIRINCGGPASGFLTFGGGAGPDAADFTEDRLCSGGTSKQNGDTIDTSAPNSAPKSVYQSERWGDSIYTIPVDKSRSYTVRLHFAETTFTAAGLRKFNVSINGTRVLNDFDEFAEAGAKNKAVVKEFPSIMPDLNGNIVIALTKGSVDEANICGIEVLPN